MVSHLPSSLCLWQRGQGQMPAAGEMEGREQDGAFTAPPPAASLLGQLKVTAPASQPSPYNYPLPLT